MTDDTTACTSTTQVAGSTDPEAAAEGTATTATAEEDSAPPTAEQPERAAAVATGTTTTTTTTAKNNDTASTNPFDDDDDDNFDNNNNNNDDDDDDNQSFHSAASIALRNDFIRLTSQPVDIDENDNMDDYDGNDGDDEFNDRSNSNDGLLSNFLTWWSQRRRRRRQQQQSQQQTRTQQQEQSYTLLSGTNNGNNNNISNVGSIGTSSSLAHAITTPRILLIIVPVLGVVAHLLFAIGQTIPMWRLSLTAEDVDVWANATGTSRWMFEALNLNQTSHYALEHNRTVQTFTYGFAVQELWHARGMPGTFLPRLAAALLVLFSGVWPHVKLVLLQYCWWSNSYNNNNHNNTNNTIASDNNNNIHPQHRRTRTLSWLALLGKWSLADVLTVCIMVGVLNIEWNIDPTTIKAGIVDHLETILLLVQKIYTVVDVCNMALHFDTKDCSAVKTILNKGKCMACKAMVKEAYYEPGWVQNKFKTAVKGVETSGGGTIRLSVVGMDGIYYFCSAVVLSVLLSVIVEWYNSKCIHNIIKEHQNRQRHNGRTTTTTMNGNGHEVGVTNIFNQNTLALTADTAPGVSSSSISSVSNDDSDAASEPLLDPVSRQLASNDDDGDGGGVANNGHNNRSAFEPMELMEPDDQSVFSTLIQRTTNSETYKCFQCHTIIPMVTMAFVAMAIYLPSMERHVGGAVPKLLNDILGIQLDKAYSLQTLRDMCGAAGGMDYLLMATFGLFCVLGPLIRAVLVVLVAMTKSSGQSTQRIRSLLVAVSNFLAAFCAWEVFFPALVMVELLMPSITNTILNTHACHVISGDGSSCLRIEFQRVRFTFACLVMGFLMVGGLAIHVSLEDSKERYMIEQNGGMVARRPAPSREAGDVEADGQYYVEVNNGGDDDDGFEDEGGGDGTNSRTRDERSGRNSNNVTTMIQQEEV